MGSKKNPGKFDCYEAAEDDEPMFVLLARDPLASALVVEWACRRATRDELPLSDHDAAKVVEARQCAADMEKWRQAHGSA